MTSGLLGNGLRAGPHGPRRSRVRGRSLVPAVLVCLLALLPSAARAGEWEWELSPYVWATDVTFDTSVNDSSVVDTEADFSDLIDKVDVGAIVRFEGSRDRVGFFVDVFYVSLSDEKTVGGDKVIDTGATVETDLDQLIAEAGGFYRVAGDESGLDILFGARLLALSVDIDYEFPNIADRSLSEDSDLVDGFAGLRYRGRLGDRWLGMIRVDAGTGDTDLSWQGIGALGFSLGESRKNALWIGYRHLEYEQESGSGVTEVELAFSGFLLGFRFGF
jgi:hypothetical protein